MNFRIYNLLCGVLIYAIAVVPVLAADKLPPYKITFVPAEHEKILRPPLQKALRGERDRLEQSGIAMSDSKLYRKELGILAKILSSEGFYRHALNYRMGNGFVEYLIEPGRMYRINTVTLDAAGMDLRLPAPDQLGLRPNLGLRAATVLEAQESLRQYLRDNNCLYQIGVSHMVALHHDSASADIGFQIKQAEQVNIDRIEINGLSTVEDSHVREILALEEGLCYQTRVIEKARLGLLQTGLFSVVETQVSPPLHGKVNISFNLRERNHRTIKAGIGFSSDENISFSAGWQHRNIFGEAQLLELEGKVSGLFKVLDTSLTVPAFRRPEQMLILEGELAEENLEAFDSTGMTLTASLKRRMGRFLSATAGIQYKFNSVREAGDENIFGLISAPITLEHDNRDNILDPRRGWVTAIEIQPFIDSLDADIMFIKSNIGASVYRTFPDFRYAPTLAARSVIGFINGNSTDSIPASERFYAGGGGSVRGYPFQKLGPLINGDPHGGRSLFEVSLEARFRIRKNWGGVIFIDGGNVYDDQFPRLDKGLRWAAGIGARYYTTFAPIRIDIGFPLNRRNGIDDAFQIYVSLAQAF